MMENLTDKNIRNELIARYLEAETDVREEMLLVEYFAEHAPEADEAAVARLLLAERPEALLTVSGRSGRRARPGGSFGAAPPRPQRSRSSSCCALRRRRPRPSRRWRSPRASAP